MAAKVLKGGAKASDMEYEVITEASFYQNTEVAKNLGITIPKDLADQAAETFDQIEK